MADFNTIVEAQAARAANGFVEQYNHQDINVRNGQPDLQAKALGWAMCFAARQSRGMFGVPTFRERCR